MYRYELKVVLNENGLSYLKHWLEVIGARVAYESRLVNSIYFDSPVFDSVRDNLAGIALREKLRLRWYGALDDSPSKFSDFQLEMKYRHGRCGSKSIFNLPSIRPEILTCRPIDLTERVFLDFRKGYPAKSSNLSLKLPILYTGYKRRYYSLMNSIRITLDSSIVFKDLQQDLSIYDVGSVTHNSYVLEFKFGLEDKSLVSNLLRNSIFNPTRHSKYLVGLSRLGYATYI